MEDDIASRKHENLKSRNIQNNFYTVMISAYLFKLAGINPCATKHSALCNVVQGFSPAET